MVKKSHSTKVLLLHAASRVIVSAGIQNLTLEAVAAEAGVSKGGLLYHFPSKEALVSGLVDHYLQQFEERLQAQVTSTDDVKAWIRAYTLATFEPPDEEAQVSAALMAAIAVNPDLLLPVRERYAAWQRQFDQVKPPALGRLLRLALDGLWLSDLLGLAPANEAERAGLQAYLFTIIEEQISS